MPRGTPGTLYERCAAYAQRMPPTHAFCGATAAALWGLPLPLDLARDPRLHVLSLDGKRAPRGRGVVGHTSGGPVETRLLAGLRVVAPVDAWLGLGTLLTIDELVAAGDRLLGLPLALADADDLDEGLRRHAGQRGARSLRAARPLVRPHVYSARETRLRLLAVRAGFPEPEPNGAIPLHTGRSTRGDLVFRAERVLLEYEGEHHLTDPVQWAKDLTRYNDLALSGWLVIRVSKHMRDADVLAALRLAFEAQGSLAGMTVPANGRHVRPIR